MHLINIFQGEEEANWNPILMNTFLIRSDTVGMIMKPVLNYHNHMTRQNKSSSMLLSLSIKPA